MASSADIDMSKHIPAQLDAPGRAAWLYIWKAGTHWISPQTDAGAVTQLCELRDHAARMKSKYDETGDMAYSKGYLDALDKQVTIMRELGLTPSARARLGVAEVKSASRLHQMRLQDDRAAKQQQRTNGL